MNPLGINLQENSEYDSMIIEFDNKKFIIEKWQIEKILEKLTIKGMALAIEKSGSRICTKK